VKVLFFIYEFHFIQSSVVVFEQFVSLEVVDLEEVIYLHSRVAAHK